MNVRWYSGKDWLGAAATLFALAVTFNAEYEIAIAVHINPIVAYAVPGALDVYVLRALQVKRDVFLTVLAMVAVNAASHLVTAGVLRVSPALIVGVSAIAPLVLWRAHVLRHAASTERRMPWTRAQRKRIAEHVPAVPEAQTETCPWCSWDQCPAGRLEGHQRNTCVKRFEHVPDAQAQTCSQGCTVWGDLGAHERAHENVPWSVPEAQMDTCDWCGYDNVPRGNMWFHQEHTCPDRFEHRDNVPGFEEHAAQAVDVASTGTVNVPEHDDMYQIRSAWEGRYVPASMAAWGEGYVDAPAAPEDIVYSGEYEGRIVPDTEARVLSLVPPLPAGFEHVLADGDKEFLDRARALSTPTIRALKELGMGNDRARRIKQYLETEHTEAQS